MHTTKVCRGLSYEDKGKGRSFHDLFHKLMGGASITKYWSIKVQVGWGMANSDKTFLNYPKYHRYPSSLVKCCQVFNRREQEVVTLFESNIPSPICIMGFSNNIKKCSSDHYRDKGVGEFWTWGSIEHLYRHIRLHRLPFICDNQVLWLWALPKKCWALL